MLSLWSSCKCTLQLGEPFDCTINVMNLNHPEVILPTQSVEKLSSTKQVFGDPKVGPLLWKTKMCLRVIPHVE